MNNALLAGLLALAACAAPSTDAAESSAAETSSGRAPVAVTATWIRALTDTPTYGYEPTAPFIQIAVEVDDSSVRADGHPAFDGLEKPFALLPHADGTSQRIDLKFEGTTMEGYIQLWPIDEYATDSLRLSEDDFAAVQKEGITISLATNVGTIETEVVKPTAKTYP